MPEESPIKAKSTYRLDDVADGNINMGDRLMNELESQLQKNIENQRTELEDLLAQVIERDYEDRICRFYRMSFTVFQLQKKTLRIVEQLRRLFPDRELNCWFQQIIDEGTGRQFNIEDNDNWPQVTRPIVEAFLHAKYFLEMACKEHKEIVGKFPAFGNGEAREFRMVSSGWLALLALFNIY